MKVIIAANNFVDICTIAKKDYGKVFFEHQRSIYPIMPECFIRLKTIKPDGAVAYDEVQVFRENSGAPYDIVGDVSYHQEVIVPMIHIVRNSHPLHPNSGIMKKAIDTYNMIYPMLGGIIAAAVIVWAFIGG